MEAGGQEGTEAVGGKEREMEEWDLVDEFCSGSETHEEEEGYNRSAVSEFSLPHVELSVCTEYAAVIFPCAGLLLCFRWYL